MSLLCKDVKRNYQVTTKIVYHFVFQPIIHEVIYFSQALPVLDIVELLSFENLLGEDYIILIHISLTKNAKEICCTSTLVTLTTKGQKEKFKKQFPLPLHQKA